MLRMTTGLQGYGMQSMPYVDLIQCLHFRPISNRMQ